MIHPHAYGLIRGVVEPWRIAAWIGNVKAQLSAASRFLSLPTLAPKVSETPGRRTAWRPIRRVLYYEWQTNVDPSKATFDSALHKFAGYVGGDMNQGPLLGPARAAFCKLVPAYKGCNPDGR